MFFRCDICNGGLWDDVSPQPGAILCQACRSKSQSLDNLISYIRLWIQESGATEKLILSKAWDSSSKRIIVQRLSAESTWTTE